MVRWFFVNQPKGISKIDKLLIGQAMGEPKKSEDKPSNHNKNFKHEDILEKNRP